MYPVSAKFLQALRGSHQVTARVEVWNGGTRVLTDLPFSQGLVTVDGTTGKVRRKLDLTCLRDDTGALWDLLAPIGTELWPYRGIRYIDGTSEEMPVGKFVIDSQSVSYGVDGTIQLSAPDRFANVQRARFLQPRTTSGPVVSSAIALTVEIAPGTSTNQATMNPNPGKQTWDRDRDDAILQLVQAAGAELFFTEGGAVKARSVPRLSNAAVWTVDAGGSGVLLRADRQRDRSRTYNTVVVNPASTDGTTFTPQVAYDSDPTSPTYTGGPFGVVPMFYSSPLITTTSQALAAGKAILSRTRGLAAQLTLEAAVNPALDAGDVIAVVLPDGTVERHLIDTVTVPLDVTTSQQITTRSTRPTGDVPDES